MYERRTNEITAASAFESVCLLLTCSERNHPEPCEGHQCVMEPVADGCAYTGQ